MPSSNRISLQRQVPFMLRSLLALPALVLAGVFVGSGLACAETGAPAALEVGLTIDDFEYIDTSGEPGDQEAIHQQRLQAFMTALRHELAAEYRVVPSSCSTQCTDNGPIADRVHAAKGAGAKVLIIGGIHKLSTLVQWAKVTAIDVDANRVVFDKLFTFRGDSDEAWQRAEVFVSREIRAVLAAYGTARDQTK
jgi:hypothetical protein